MGGIRWDAKAADSPTQPSSRRAPVACVAALGAPGVITSGPTPARVRGGRSTRVRTYGACSVARGDGWTRWARGGREGRDDACPLRIAFSFGQTGDSSASVSSSGDMVVRGVRCLYAPRLRHTLRGGAVFVMCRLIFKALVA